MSETFRLQLLGTPTLVRGARAWVLPLERRSQLLVVLALSGGWVTRRDAGALLWPDLPGPAVAAYLRKTLFRLAQLPWAEAIESEGGALRFGGEADVHRFESALQAGDFDAALALWRGEPLAGFDDDANPAWTERLRHERERLRAAWRSAAFEWLERDPPAAAAVGLSARLLEHDPWDEAALQQHLKWLQASQQDALARQVHAAFVQRVRNELGVAPSASLLALAPPTTTQAAAAAPSRPALQPVRMQASAAGTVDAGFIGRGAELRQIALLLEADEGRLITLMGPGGVGKTRLAHRAAQELAPGFADGATVVALEDLAAPEGLAAHLARALHLPADDAGLTMETLARHLHGQHRLLVLDNFEHLADAAPAVEILLQGCPRLKLIVTSRVRLGLAVEQALPIEGLPCPDAEDADHAEAFDAVRLFVRAAQRVAPAFRPAAEMPAVIALCDRLGGLPLALELAAAWTRVLSCADIAAELGRGTELLRSGDLARAARHASMDQVFEQSWRLLGAAERHALARLSLFRGGFTAEAARAVAAAAPPVLGALVDQSLLVKHGQRLHLHPLVQQFAATRLRADDGAVASAAAHAHYFVDLMARLRAQIRDGEPAALKTLDAEFENCRAAWLWAVDVGDAGPLARSAEVLCDLGDYRGRVGDVLALFDVAIASAVLAAPTRHRAAVLAPTAFLAYRLDRYDRATQHAREALRLATEHTDDESRLQALNVLSSCALHLGRLDEARDLLGQHLQLAQAAFGPVRVARTRMNLALVEKAAGRQEVALQLYGQALRLAERFGDLILQVRCMHNLALLHMVRGELELAGARLESARGLCEQHGFATMRSAVLGALVDHARLGGDFDAAHRHAGTAIAAARELGQRGLLCGLTVDRALIALHRGKHDEARFAVADAAEQALALGRPSLELNVASAFADLLHATGQLRAAARVLELMLGHPTTTAAEHANWSERRATWLGQARPVAAAATPAGSDPPALQPGSVEALLQRVAAEAAIDPRALIAELGVGAG